MLYAQFEWLPYKKNSKEFFNKVSKENKTLFATDSLLISYWVLEHHPSPRVMRQFGLSQAVPLPASSNPSFGRKIREDLLDTRVKCTRIRSSHEKLSQMMC